MCLCGSDRLIGFMMRSIRCLGIVRGAHPAQLVQVRDNIFLLALFIRVRELRRLLCYQASKINSSVDMRRMRSARKAHYREEADKGKLYAGKMRTPS